MTQLWELYCHSNLLCISLKQLDISPVSAPSFLGHGGPGSVRFWRRGRTWESPRYLLMAMRAHKMNVVAWETNQVPIRFLAEGCQPLGAH